MKRLSRFALLVAFTCCASLGLAQTYTPTHTGLIFVSNINAGPGGHAFGTISVPEAAVVSHLKFRFSITHPLTDNLEIKITSPGAPGTTHTIIAGAGFGANYTNTILADGAPLVVLGSNPFTGFYEGEQLLALYNGLAAQGTWYFDVYNHGGFAGTLDAVDMELNGPPYVLPVEMTSFSASAADNRVSLSWHTETETNNSHFNLYRATLQGECSSFIGRVNGHGTSATANDYSFVDFNVVNGNTYYYYISDVSLEGVESFSNFTTSATPAPHALGEIPFKYTLSQNFPNPFNPTTSITYGIHKAGLVRLSVYNELGKEVAVLVNQFQTPNTYRFEYNAASLASGTYYYTLKTVGFTTTKKMTLTK